MLARNLSIPPAGTGAQQRSAGDAAASAGQQSSNPVAGTSNLPSFPADFTSFSRLATDPNGVFLAGSLYNSTVIRIFKIITKKRRAAVRGSSSSSSSSSSSCSSSSSHAENTSRSSSDIGEYDNSGSDDESCISSSSSDDVLESSSSGSRSSSSSASTSTSDRNENSMTIPVPSMASLGPQHCSAADKDGRGERGGRARRSAVSLQFLCETAPMSGSVTDLSWGQCSMGLFLAAAYDSMYVNVFRLHRAPDGSPICELITTYPSSRLTFTIRVRDAPLAIAFSPARTPVPLLCMGLFNGQLNIVTILSDKERREAVVSLGEAALIAAGVDPDGDDAYGYGGLSSLPPVGGTASAGGTQLGRVGSTTNSASLAAAAESRRGAPITAVAWSPSCAEKGYVLAVGFFNGVCFVVRVDQQSYAILLRIDNEGSNGSDNKEASTADETKEKSKTSAVGTSVAHEQLALESPSSPPPPRPIAAPPPRPVTSIAWAPPLGKLLQTIAYCSDGDGTVNIVTVRPVMGLKRQEWVSAGVMAHTMASLSLVGSCRCEGLGAVRLAWSKCGERLFATCAGDKTAIITKAVLKDHMSWRVAAVL